MLVHDVEGRSEDGVLVVVDDAVKVVVPLDGGAEVLSENTPRASTRNGRAAIFFIVRGVESFKANS